MRQKPAVCRASRASSTLRTRRQTCRRAQTSATRDASSRRPFGRARAKKSRTLLQTRRELPQGRKLNGVVGYEHRCRSVCITQSSLFGFEISVRVCLRSDRGESLPSSALTNATGSDRFPGLTSLHHLHCPCRGTSAGSASRRGHAVCALCEPPCRPLPVEVPLAAQRRPRRGRATSSRPCR